MSDSPKKQLIAFDFDGTITSKDTLLDFLWHGFGKRRLITELLRLAPSLVLMKLGLVDNGGTKRRLLSRYLTGRKLSCYEKLARKYCAERFDKLVTPQMRELIKKYKEEGAEVAIVTASLSLWVRPFAEALGVDKLIATEAEVDSNGVFTGNFSTPNCHGPQKVERLLAEYPDREAYHLTAYGDSSGDTQMLALADESHRVKNGRLIS